jgi:hypothetical protein
MSSNKSENLKTFFFNLHEGFILYIFRYLFSIEEKKKLLWNLTNKGNGHFKLISIGGKDDNGYCLYA